MIPLRVRLTLWYTAALIVVLACFCADLLWEQGRLGLRRLDRDLEAFSVTASNILRDEMGETSDSRAAALEVCATTATPGRAVAILDSHGTVLAARWNGLDPSAVGTGVSQGDAPSTASLRSGPWRMLARRQTFGTTSLLLFVAAPLADIQRERQEVEEAMVVGLPIVLLIASGGGLWLAAVGLRPLTAMADRASRIPLNGMEDLGDVATRDELGRLATAFNGLVARLRAALQTQRQFMADASHELRTPVSVVRTATEVTLSRSHREEADYREALTIVGGQATRLGRLVEDMVVLARADAGGYPLRPVDFYLDELIAECRRAANVLAVERGTTIDGREPPEIPFRGDEDLLRRMVLNVLHNAVQHTPPGGVIGLGVSHTDGHVEIRVSDSGAGIPPDDRSRIFDRFVQLDQARRSYGSGLGLPIARWIAEAHHGTLVLEVSGPSGSTFCMSLPCSG